MGKSGMIKIEDENMSKGPVSINNIVEQSSEDPDSPGYKGNRVSFLKNQSNVSPQLGEIQQAQSKEISEMKEQLENATNTI